MSSPDHTISPTLTIPPERPTDILLDARDLSITFGAHRVLDQVSFQLSKGEVLAVLGESGCGKTTLMRIVACLLAPDRGTMTLGGLTLSRLAPQRRGVVYLSQEPLLFEHLNILENIGFAARLRGETRAAVARSAQELLRAIGLDVYGSKRAWEISGGQKQRVAFARAIMARPRLLLLDEPFGSLDGSSRAAMQRLFSELCARYQMTCLFVTHDLKEALLVGTRYASLRAGRLSLYPSRESFRRDPATGIPQEAAFWEHLDANAP